MHTFHIPVMGLAYTVDTPAKVAHLGISSVVSVGDDHLIDQVRTFYANKYGIAIDTIDRKDIDHRAKIVTSYLNLLQTIVQNNWKQHIDRLVADPAYLDDFMALLPDEAYWKNEWHRQAAALSQHELVVWAAQQFPPGMIDVNIMTKLDKPNFSDGAPLPIEYNDAHALLRGFAQSNLHSSIVLSAGMNLPLFGYMQRFDDFFPIADGTLNKKITIKVSDFRSALTQGKMLAKKGLWVSEFRIESGLNCGGHAFPTQGQLMGPILEEFKQRRQELYQELYDLWIKTLVGMNRTVPTTRPELKITAQGGVGTHQEHAFLLTYYNIQSVGWGSPFLLVPEAVSIDDDTLSRLVRATEKDLYLSNASPLGVPFNNLRNSGRQLAQQEKAAQGKPGNPCTKKFLQLNSEFGDKPLCTASSAYINKATEQLTTSGLSDEALHTAQEELLEKECLCCGLALPFLEQHKLNTKLEGAGVTVCPGPNIAYFDRVYSLREMIMHIYGRTNLITRTDRPNMFIKEAQLYIDYLSDKLTAFTKSPDDKARNYIDQFIRNMKNGLQYYRDLFEKEMPEWNNLQYVVDDLMKSLEFKQERLLEVALVPC